MMSRGQSRELGSEAHSKRVDEKTEPCSFLVKLRMVGKVRGWPCVPGSTMTGVSVTSLWWVGSQYLRANDFKSECPCHFPAAWEERDGTLSLLQLECRKAHSVGYQRAAPCGQERQSPEDADHRALQKPCLSQPES